MRRAADILGLRPEQVEAALAYYAEFTEEIDSRPGAGGLDDEELLRAA